MSTNSVNKLCALVLVAVLGIFSSTLTGAEPEDEKQTIEGILQVISPADGQSYFAVDIGREIETPSDAGGMRRGRVLQIAGLNEDMVNKAARLVGKRVVIAGRPMGALTVHHYTEVLWLATGIEEADSKKTP